MDLNLKHFLFMLFFRNFKPNLTKYILVLQQLQRKELINTLRIFLFISLALPLWGGGASLPPPEIPLG